MRKTTTVLVALMLTVSVILTTGCKKSDDPNNEGGETPISTNAINGSIRGNLDITGLFVETMYDKVALNGEDFSVEVADCDIPQFIAVTDADTNIYMLYRGWVTEGNPVVIDANSTAQALITMHPVLGPIVDHNEYGQLLEIINASPHFLDLKQHIATAIAERQPITDTTNTLVTDAMYGFFEELTALAGLDSLQGRPDISDFLESYPMMVVSENNTLTMRVTGLSPSYYGTVTNEQGHSENIRVLSRADYGGMDLFTHITHTVENAHWGDPTYYTFQNPGEYNFNFSRNNAQGLADFYLHLANNIAGLLGMDMDNQMLEALSSSIGAALEAVQGDYGDDGLGLAGLVYDGVVDYLSNPQLNNGRWRNWRLAGSLLSRLSGLYNVIKNASNALVRITQYLQAPNDIDFCLEYYSSSGINPCSETTITIIGGNNQIGFAHKTLPGPLEVYVTSQTDNGWNIHPEYVVRFSVVSGDGELVQEDVEVDENHKANTSWTLGEQGEQEVSAVVIDPDTGKELSNKVYFTATFNEGFVTTLPISDITETTAIGGGIIADEAMTFVTRCGICWNTSGVPTIDDSQVFTGPGTGTFHCNIRYLTPNTTYHVRAFVSFGIENEYYYGDEVTFDTEGDDWVDLGLPSGLLWATRNVGANSIDEYGDHFAWAETQPKSVYNWNTYQYCCHNSVTSLTKYCSSSYYGCNGYTDHLTVLEPSDDPATVNWGGGARMATYNEWNELFNNCSKTMTRQNRIWGLLLTGANGNTLFLPAAGYRSNSNIINEDRSGYYWTSTFYAPCGAYGEYFDLDTKDLSIKEISMRPNIHRDGGVSIRAVRSRNQN